MSDLDSCTRGYVVDDGVVAASLFNLARDNFDFDFDSD